MLVENLNMIPRFDSFSQLFSNKLYTKTTGDNFHIPYNNGHEQLAVKYIIRNLILDSWFSLSQSFVSPATGLADIYCSLVMHLIHTTNASNE